MNERIQSAFDQVRAERELKEHTLAALAKKTGGFSRPVRRFRPLAAAAAALALVVLCAGGSWWYLTPVSAISIDSSATVELGLNRLDRVVSVQGYDEAGRALADELELDNLSYTQALETILDSEAISASLAQGEQMSISVVASSDEKSQALFSGVQACTGQEENIHCTSGDPQLLHQAHECGLSLGKYQAYLTLSQLDPSITAEQVQNMSMRQIREWIWQLSGDGNTPAQGQQGGQAGHGQGQHAGHHWWDD